MGIFIRITTVMRWQQRAELNEKDTLNKKWLISFALKPFSQ